MVAVSEPVLCHASASSAPPTNSRWLNVQRAALPSHLPLVYTLYGGLLPAPHEPARHRFLRGVWPCMPQWSSRNGCTPSPCASSAPRSTHIGPHSWSSHVAASRAQQNPINPKLYANRELSGLGRDSRDVRLTVWVAVRSQPLHLIPVEESVTVLVELCERLAPRPLSRLTTRPVCLPRAIRQPGAALEVI